MNTKPKVGLLGLYLELYDRTMPEERARVEVFYSLIVDELTRRGLEVVTSPVCRMRGEVSAVVHKYERQNVEAIMTLHLAYSPSLESAETLAASRLPLIILDVTPADSFGPSQDPAEVMTNHGIHGVQDLCNMLIRLNKPFRIEAGHWQKSDVLDRITGWAQAAHMASTLHRQRVGRIGEAFRGMGDFQVESEVLHINVGMETTVADFELLKSLMPEVSDPAVKAEMKQDREEFDCTNLDKDDHSRSARVNLAIRRWLERGNLTGFSFNFTAFEGNTDLPTLPFLEASKAMGRGIGYAGEGDVLTAGFVGTLLSVFPETSFSEMFCPDWEGGTIFLSHMGEINTRVCDGKPSLICKPMSFLGTGAPVIAAGRFKPGEVVIANLAPGPEKTFTLILAPGEVVVPAGKDNFSDSIRGWYKPQLPVSDFLEGYSRLGATHHSAIIYQADIDALIRFADIMQWDCAVLGE